jgi:hypothetical protein
MSSRMKTIRAAVVLAAAGGLLLTGCGSQEAGTHPVSDTRPAAARPAAPKTPAVSAAKPAKPAAVAHTSTEKPMPEPEPEVPVEVTPSELPPGDPGLDAPAVPDPGRPQGDREHEEPALTEVPTEALLDAATVSGVLGGSWQASPGQQVECASVAEPVAQRTHAFDADGGRLVQTVATHRSPAAADRAVTGLAGQLQQCGWSIERDPRLGAASAAATSADGRQTLGVISAEGVTVTLVASGTAATDRLAWSSLLDLALGNSCAAAPHGCH